MRRTAGAGNASILLAKASSQLKGGNNQATNEEADEDGVGAYLKSLSRKSATAEPQWDKFGELSDLSDDGLQQGNAVIPSAAVANKFLKKKPNNAASSQSAQAPNSQNPIPSRQSGGNLPVKSSALSKIDALASRYRTESYDAPVSRKKSNYPASDSESDLGLSLDEEVMADVRALRNSVPTKQPALDTPSRVTSSLTKVTPGPVQQPAVPSVTRSGQQPPSQAFQPAAPSSSSIFRGGATSLYSDDDDSQSSSIQIGKGGSKFMKKRQSLEDDIPEVKETAKIQNIQERATTKPKVVDKATKQLNKSNKQIHMTVLDSDDESLAEYMDGLSSSTVSGEKKRLVSSNPKGTTIPSRTAVAGSTKNGTPKRFADSASEDESDHFRINIGDLDLLAAHDKNSKTMKSNSRTSDSSSKIVLSLSDLPKAKNVINRDKGTSSNGNSFNLGHLGLHSIDELLGNADTDSRISSEPPQYESDFESVGAPGSSSSRVVSPAPTVPPLRSILSVTPRPLTPKSSRSRVRLMDEMTMVRSRSPSPISTGRSTTEIPEEEYDSTTRSAATIRTASDSSEQSDSDTTRVVSDSEVSVSSVRKTRRGSSRSGRRSSEPLTSASRRSPSLSARSLALSHRSWRSSRTESETSYSEDFTSAAVTADVLSDAGGSRRTSITDGDTLVNTDVKSTSLPARRRPRSAVSMRDCGIQTGLDVGLHYNWPAGSLQATESAQYGLAFVDPASIAVSVVSADTLEAMTAYTPSAIALNDLLSQQVMLTKQYLAMQSRLHYDLVSSLELSKEPYQYTTLEDTKEYIRRHKRPVLTFKQALKEAKLEMGLC